MAVQQVERVQTERDKCKQEAIEQLEWAIDQIRNNDGISVTGIVETHGSYRVFGSPVMSRLQTAGALLELAVDRLDRSK